MADKADWQLEIGRAVQAERRRCITIAESFIRDAETEGEAWIARRIAEVIATWPALSSSIKQVNDAGQSDA